MTKSWPTDTYILIPSYNSDNPLKRFVKELSEIVPKGNICVVDDGSSDGTYEFCVDFGVTCLRHEVNKGKGAALRTGFAYLTKYLSSVDECGINTNQISNDVNSNINTSYATDNKTTAKWIITMDADGQHSPADLCLFLEEAVKYPTMGLCIGARDMRAGVMPPARILSNRLTSAILTLLTKQRIRDSQCGYRMYSRELVASINIEYDRFQMESEVILKAAAKNFPIRFVPVQTLYLRGGSSHISHIADTLRWAAAVLRIFISKSILTLTLILTFRPHL